LAGGENSSQPADLARESMILLRLALISDDNCIWRWAIAEILKTTFLKEKQ